MLSPDPLALVKCLWATSADAAGLAVAVSPVERPWPRVCTYYKQVIGYISGAAAAMLAETSQDSSAVIEGRTAGLYLGEDGGIEQPSRGAMRPITLPCARRLLTPYRLLPSRCLGGSY